MIQHQYSKNPYRNCSIFEVNKFVWYLFIPRAPTHKCFLKSFGKSSKKIGSKTINKDCQKIVKIFEMSQESIVKGRIRVVPQTQEKSRLTVLSTQKELGAHLWICFRYLCVDLIFDEKIFFQFFFRRKFFARKKNLPTNLEFSRILSNFLRFGKSGIFLGKNCRRKKSFEQKDPGFVRFRSRLIEQKKSEQKILSLKKVMIDQRVNFFLPKKI